MGLRQHPGPLTILGPAGLALFLVAGCTYGSFSASSLIPTKDLSTNELPSSLPFAARGTSVGASANPAATAPAAPSPLTVAMQRAGSHYERGIQAMRSGDADHAEGEFDAALETLLDLNLIAGSPSASLDAAQVPLLPPSPWLTSLAKSSRTTEPQPEASDDAEDVPLDAPALLGPEDLQAVTEPPAATAPEPDTQRYDIPIVFNDQVKTFINYFQTQKWGVITRAFDRAGRYLPIMRKIFREKGLPEDLLNLAFIESAVNPRATSRAKAAGIWQFIASTAQLYGMRTSWWLDERRDPEKSTRGAAEYLKTLYRMFNSWPLALAAYNAGEGAVQRAIDRQGTRDFWKLRLPKETQLFVPAFMAMTVISKEPERYGFSPPAEALVQTEKVILKHATDLQLIAKAARTTLEHLRELNPELIRWATPPSVSHYSLNIPLGRQADVQEVLARIPADQRITWIRHRIRKGETPALIAKRYGTDTQTLLEMNHLQKRQALKPGGTLLVPPPQGEWVTAAGEAPAEKAPAARRTDAASSTYTVRKGDTLSEIARAHGAPLEELLRWNGLSKRATLRLGQRLVVARPQHPSPTGIARPRTAATRPAPRPAPRPTRYVVRRGDTLWEIARLHGVSAEELRRWNNLPKSAELHPGQELQLSESPS